MEEELCKQCGKSLYWEDTYRIEGGIEEGYLIENQIWVCENCQKEYTIIKQGYFHNVDIINFEEA